MSILEIQSNGKMPGDCDGEESNGEMVDWVGYSIDTRDGKEFGRGGIMYRVVMRCVTHILYNEVTNMGAFILDDGPDYVDQIVGNFNGSSVIGINSLTPIFETDLSRWVVDSESVTPYGIYGCGIMSKRREYLCEGPWGSLASQSEQGVGFQVGYDNKVGPCFESVEWKNETGSSNEPGKIVTDWQDIQTTGTKKRIFRVNTYDIIENVSFLKPPATWIENSFIETVDGFVNMDNSVSVDSIDGKKWSLMAEHLEPYDKQGGSFFKWAKEYVSIGEAKEYTTTA